MTALDSIEAVGGAKDSSREAQPLGPRVMRDNAHRGSISCRS
jgi:hypothetical protein